MVSRTPLVFVFLVAARGCLARQPIVLQGEQEGHARGLKQAILSPVANVINGAAQGVGSVVSGVTLGTVKPGFFVNASDGTLTGNAFVDLNAPLSSTCCNASISTSGGFTNGTVYASALSGQIFPVAWPGWTGDIARIGNISAGVAAGRAVDGAQGTFFFGDHINNQTGQIQTDWYTISGQLKPNKTLLGYDVGNQYFNFFFGNGNVSQLYTGTGRPVPNGV